MLDTMLGAAIIGGMADALQRAARARGQARAMRAIERSRPPVRCDYCRRGSTDATAETCNGCGAPLPLGRAPEPSSSAEHQVGVVYGFTAVRPDLALKVTS